MSKRIDFRQPLSADDAAYVADRPWLLRDAELAGIEVTFDDDFTVDAEDDEQDENTNPEGGSEETGDGSEGGSEESEDDESDDEDEAVDYSTWEYADLKEEAGNRDLSKAGSKEQLIARLQEDDAARAEEESDEDDSEDDESE